MNYNSDIAPNTSKSPSGPYLSMRVIEEWLDETLTNANELCLTKKLLKQDKKTVISQFGIDR